MGVMGGTQPGRLVVRLLALALAFATGSLPGAAQDGSEAVVCVGSERRTLATNPIRRVYTEDMELVYRIGADIGQRDQVERDLSSETQATTINQRFSSQSDGSGYEVLLRETWSVAQTGVAEGAVAVGDERGTSPPDGPICTERASSESCWAEVSNHPGCYLWNPEPRDGATLNWSGECLDGIAEGRGEGRWQWNDGSAIETGSFQGGRREGFHVVNLSNGDRFEGTYLNDERHATWTFAWENGARAVGPFVNGEKHGNWTESSDHWGQGEGPYVNGERHGTWTFYYPEGRRSGNVGPYFREVGPYVNGEPHGTFTGYDAAGDVMWTARFQDGRRVGGLDDPAAPGRVPWQQLGRR